jgi:zinc transporter
MASRGPANLSGLTAEGDVAMSSESRQVPVVRSGSEHGLICGFLLAADGSSDPIEIDAVSEALAAGERVVWLHFNASSASARRWLGHSGIVSPHFLDLVDRRETRVQCVATDSGLVAVIPDLAFGEAVDPSEVVHVWVHASSRLLVTARDHAAQTADLLRQSARGGLGAASGQALFARLLEVQVELLRGWLGRATDELDHAEDQILIGNVTRQRAALGRTRRQAMHLRRNFGPLRAGLQRLLSDSVARGADVELEAWRAVQEEFAFTIDEATGAYERAKLLQEELSSRLAEATGQNLFVLTVTTIVFLPMTLLSGIFGMNVQGVPGVGEHAPTGAFWWAVSLIVAAGVVTWLLVRVRRRM